MRKLILVLHAIFIAIALSAQLTSNGNYWSMDPENKVDRIFIYNGISSGTELVYSGSYNAINWYKISDLNSAISNQNYMSPEDNTGYVLDVDGVKTVFWVFDYNNYLPQLNSLTVDNNSSVQCEKVKLYLNAVITPMAYSAVDGTSYELERSFSLTYNTLSWNENWTTIEKKYELTLPANEIEVETPWTDTQFTISGDQFATLLGLELPSITSDYYAAVAPVCKITTTAIVRNEKQEDSRPANPLPASISGPVDIQFASNANAPVANFYNWTIFKDNQLLVTRTDVDQRFTFSEAGVYNVKLRVSNAYCAYSDSITITVSSSSLAAPNVFTPNGDGINDEFRVAYKSIVEFHATILNRWGRKVFEWTDPQKGWDGTISGKPAAQGAYFYIITAVGADGQKYKLKGDINLLRGKNN